jgi:hypothetical protein
VDSHNQGRSSGQIQFCSGTKIGRRFPALTSIKLNLKLGSLEVRPLPGADMAQSFENDQQPPAKKADDSGLLAHSGFMDGIRSLKKTASNLVDKGVQKGHELVSSPTGQRISAQVVDASHHVLASPVTKTVVREATQTGRQLANENVSNVNGAIAAGKHGDVLGVVRHAAPIATEVALGPGGVVMHIAKDKVAEAAIGQAPASQRPALEHMTQLIHGASLRDVTLTGLARSEVAEQTHIAKQRAVNAAFEPTSTTPARTQHPVEPDAQAASTSTTSDFLQRLKAKLKQDQIKQ